jgi:hypothetical protein
METLLTPECVLRTPIETLLGQHSPRPPPPPPSPPRT